MVVLAAALPARAGLLLSDDFESGTISGATWATNFSGSLVADPLSSGHGFVLHFGSAGSGGDMFSYLMSYTDPVTIEFDFLQTGTTNSGAYVGTDHQTTPYGAEQWILNTGGGGAYPNLDGLSAGSWHHVSLTLNIYDPSSVGSFALKLEQTDGGSGIGNAYFDNIQVGTPEPGPLAGILIGLGALAVRRFRARS
jgi:hypothetical protein